MTTYLGAVPAYGQDYRSAKAVREDWEAGKDFRINDISSRYDGAMINKDDKPADIALTVRFDKMRKTVVIK